MNTDKDLEHQLQQANKRIADLEENFHWALETLETVASLGNLQQQFINDSELDELLNHANAIASKIIPFHLIGYLKFNEEEGNFIVFKCNPEDQNPKLQSEIDFNIENGIFAWAIQQNRTVTVATQDGESTLILHSLSTHNKLHGMFAGIIHKSSDSLFGVSLDVLSMIVNSIALAWDNFEFYNVIQDYNENLESKVQNRTRELEESRKNAHSAVIAKSAFLANMSHTLKTPLNAILGYSEMLMEDALAEDREHTYQDLKRIYDAGSDLLGMITDILDLAKMDTGKLKFNAQEFLLSEIINNVINRSRDDAEQNNNRINADINIKNDNMISDPQRIQNILFQLLVNACKFTEEGTVSIEVTETEYDGAECLQFVVSDTGAGMAPETVEILFEDFRQGDETASKKHEGTGLGLAITKRICEILGGHVWVESAQGKGSRFYVRLPRDSSDNISRHNNNQ